MASLIPSADVTLCTNSDIINKNEKPKKKSKGHRCYFCGQRFMDKNILRKHISVHKDRDFFCDVCGKAFSANWGLRKHMKTHTGERPFQCEHCGKAFIQKCTLQFHIKAIHSNKSHPRCKSCGKRLKSAAYLQCWLCRYEGKEIKEDGEQLSASIEDSNKDVIELRESQHFELNSSQTAVQKVSETPSENNAHGDLQKFLQQIKSVFLVDLAVFHMPVQLI